MYSVTRKIGFIETYCLLAIDIICLVIAYQAAIFIRFTIRSEYYSANLYNTVSLYLLLICVLYGMLIGANRNFFTRGYYIEFISVAKYIIIMSLVVLGIMYFTKSAELFSREIMIYFGILNFILCYIGRIIFKRYMLVYFRKGNHSSKVMIITTYKGCEQLIDNILKDRAWNYQITSVAFVDENHTGEVIKGLPVVASRDNIFEIAKKILLDEVFIYLPDEKISYNSNLIENFESMGIVCHYNVDTINVKHAKKVVGNFAGYAVVSFLQQNTDYRRVLLKRIMDILGGMVGLAITIVLFPFVALAIKVESKGPIFFSQIRIGKNGRRFKILKYRSMYLDAEARKKDLQDQNEMQGLMFKMDKDPRITKVGKILRKTSIDELPQFFNILIGQMSLVGTRPPTEDEFAQYSIYYRRRLSITPGLTGLWQVNGRGSVTDFEDVVTYDLEYIDNWSIGLDLKILMQTIAVVFKAKGAK